jgi:hypothetical protein
MNRDGITTYLAVDEDGHLACRYPMCGRERISMRYLFLLLALASTGCGHRRAYTSGHPQPVDTDSGEYRVLQTHEGDYVTFYCRVTDGSTVCKPVE